MGKQHHLGGERRFFLTYDFFYSLLPAPPLLILANYFSRFLISRRFVLLFISSAHKMLQYFTIGLK